jgi:hypothetical protein
MTTNTNAAIAITTETFAPFSEKRKAMIKHLKAFLKSPENRPYKNTYGTKFQVLFLEDYAVYAALRGADFKKVSHMEEGENAREAIETVIKRIEGITEKSAERIKSRDLPISSVVIRYLPEGSTFEDLAELKVILSQTLTH